MSAPLTAIRTISTSVRAEFARLVSSRMAVLALVALMTIPVVYGGLYLWGNKDPYGSLDKVPAAIVVADEGATVDGAKQNYGRDAADTLLDGKKFAWHEVSAVAASRGVQNGTYDFAVEFPASFSSDIASASGDAPVPARLGLLTNDTNSYLSTTIATQATTTVRAAIVEKVGRAATLQLLDGVQSLRDGLSDAADGAQQLSDGAHSASDGATELSDGASSAADGAAQLATGAAAADAGAGSLASGTAQLSTGASSLSSGLQTLKSSTTDLPMQAQTLAAGAHRIAGGVTTLHGAATDAESSLAAALATSDIPADQQAVLLAKVGALAVATGDGSQLATGTQALDAGAAKLAASAPALQAAIGQAADGAAAVASGAQSAATGAATLKDGTAKLSSGATALKSGTAELASGASTLADGTTQLADGADTLHGELVDGVAKTPSKTDAQRSATADAVADPVAVKQTAQSEAQNYGAGLAPFFISLAAWIGIYALFLLVRPLSRRALTAVRRPVATALAGWATPALLGVVQMIGLFLVLAGPLGLSIAHPVQLLGFMALVSVTYAAIVLALNVWLGSVGQFLGLVLMVVQLVTAGGTFPWQTLPAPLAALHQALPMAHAVDGIRALVYGGGSAGLSSALITLLIWLAVSLLASIAGAAKQSRFRTLRELRPSPIGG
ncbi:YhgE/Pip domain-containing protein [Schumannella sp. 10F1B-5-1]|nr:YhgE/Pip domain-containing protein [Schumannella sp. 10F1B-5-1]